MLKKKKKTKKHLEFQNSLRMHGSHVILLSVYCIRTRMSFLIRSESVTPSNIRLALPVVFP